MKSGRIAIIFMALVLAACSKSGASPSVSPTVAAPAASDRGTSKIVAEARVVPARSAALGFRSGGVIAEVLVSEGARLAANQPIVRLESRQQKAAVDQAQANLNRAQAQLDALKAGPRAQEVAAAQASLDAAQALVTKLQGGARAQDVAIANSAVGIARAQLAQAQQGASEQQLDAARAELANAQAAVKQAQAAYDDAYNRNPASIGASPAALALEQATNNFAAAKARYDDLARGPSGATVDVARAQLQQALRALDAAKAPASAADLDVAKAEVRRAQAQLDLVKAGARAEDIAAAQANVDAAKATLSQAQAVLTDTELRAPFAGVLASLDARMGESVSPGGVVARVGDMSAWEINTTDVTELTIANLREGGRATITFDAIPGLELAGKIARIRPYGENRQGDMVYTVVVAPDNADPRLRWNMTASMAFEQ